MARALVLGVAGLEVAAVVGGEEHDRVVEQVEAAQRVEQPAQRLIQPLDHAVVAAEVLRGGATQLGQVRRRPPARILLAVTHRGGIVVQVVLVVRFEVGDEQEKRLCLV